MNSHQSKQKQIIEEMDRQVRNNALNFSSVASIDNYETDSRLCLTSVHIPSKVFTHKIQSSLIQQLQHIKPEYYYYSDNSLHITIKNVRVVNNPPHFTEETTTLATGVFNDIVQHNKKFRIYFYKLILFPNNVSLIGTTDPEFDDLFLDLDKGLKAAGIPDDKRYLNAKYFFCTMTLCRFNTEPSSKFVEKVKELENSIMLEPYEVDSVTLLTCNAMFKKQNLLGTWDLQ